MEKKRYITPECEVVVMETMPMMSSTSPTGSVGEDKEYVEEDDMGANRHRGEWGDLWSDWK